MQARIAALVSVAVLSATPAAVLALSSCSASAPPQAHDNVVNDTRDATTTVAPPSDAAAPDAFTYDYGDGGAPDGSTYVLEVPDGYAPVIGCDTCACSGSGDAGKYCFGGGGGKTTFPSSCDLDAGASIEVGCNGIPAACTGLDPKDTCPCILEAIGMFPCYLVCGISATGYSVYCPHP